MARRGFQEKLNELLQTADVKLNGSRRWDMQVHDERLYRRILAGGSLAAGEAYMDGWWDCEALGELFERLLRARLDEKIKARDWWWDALVARIFNLQKPSRAFQIGKRHYDTGNDLFRIMLDERMIYSCGYWADASSVDEAQEAKLDLVCRKLQLKPGMKVLDIGCGWGGAARFAAERYSVEVVGITVSEQQANFAREYCRGLPVDIRLQDYRDMNEKFDRIFSIGMFEHVGYKNYRTYMKKVRELLKPEGLFLLHTIGGNSSVTRNDPWIAKYIFPNSMLPSPRQITASAEDLFVMEDWHNFGVDYDKTLLAWYHNFEKGWPLLKEHYDERFYRMWRYYLLMCAGAFRARSNQLWQVVLSPEGIKGGYVAPRYRGKSEMELEQKIR
ncbi:cyclopropane fatty acyl phospholipid synthase [Prolixibacter sp. NT017]|uniref:cyclopropane fatty acyl phospholipid synthase n=1 Tax=Prolixibacter sp. NT017 TaxID=2652390 RepID=UPI0012806653|nr:cyclopropane fatty acyl phospholipid synthase [Prolixibacter sp. NT017]GET26272.1 cyclopropane-fatty-acyl-phospholipid synthase [Prolixibacter sp. NT017]